MLLSALLKYTFWLFNPRFWHKNIPFGLMTHAKKHPLKRVGVFCGGASRAYKVGDRHEAQAEYTGIAETRDMRFLWD